MYTSEGTIKDLREVLRIKIKALATEAQIIRGEEHKLKKRSNPAKVEYQRLRREFRRKGWSGEELKEAIRSAKRVRWQTRQDYPTRPDPIREQMYLHRVGVVRKEARHAHIVYGLIKGRNFADLMPRYVSVDWKEIGRLLEKYGLVQDAEKVVSALVVHHNKAALGLH